MEKYKNYKNEEELENDYENFIKDWQKQDETNYSYWRHKTGIEMRVVFLDCLKVEMKGLRDWKSAQKQKGLSKEEILSYNKRLVNQFKLIYKKNYQPPKQTTLEKRIKGLEIADSHIIQMFRETGQYTEEKLTKMAEDQKKFREELLKEEQKSGR